ncbi:hypothetical protein B0T14DRAFT_492103 [Immersiella caudata]|uniref:NADH dehydrogenase [ubiquinone] 1 alpha subcomplex subunit 8 n=1 Tax=Immersiella caudata TaxID=314043 RepID=A0AA39XI60_9PEZI|nr:hypothetical protein B0T14DRAFT_492103 [Immersiella caudata]
MAARKPIFNQHVLYDTTPLPESIPKVKELGTTSAPLMSAAFFIGARCKDYNDDFMQCKTENPGKGEFECLKEGRRVTRCARSVIKDINANCLDQFKAHWECLENNNQQMWQCRQKEWSLNKCVFDKLGLEKRIPDQPKDEVPVQFRRNQIYAHASIPITQFPYLTPSQRAEQVENLRLRDPKKAARIDLWDEQQRQKEAAEAAAAQTKA